MSENVKKFGTPSPKAAYQRLGMQMEELQNQPFYKGKSLEMAKLANEMSRVYALEMERVRMEKDVHSINYTIDIETKQLSE